MIPKGGPSLFARNKDTKKVGGDSEELKGEKCFRMGARVQPVEW